MAIQTTPEDMLLTPIFREQIQQWAVNSSSPLGKQYGPTVHMRSITTAVILISWESTDLKVDVTLFTVSSME